MTSGDHEAYLGVDSGGSGLRALLIDRHAGVLGYASGPLASHQVLGIEQAMSRLDTLIEDVCANAQRPRTAMAAAHFALTGDDTSDDHACLAAGLEALLCGLPFTLGNDVWAGLRAGSTSGIGIAVNCGSGTGTVGRNARGESIIFADLGYEFGDSGGGGQMAVDAFRVVIRAWQGRGQPTTLTGSILDLTGQPDVEALYLAMYRRQITRTTQRQATRLVLQAAAAGDAVALGIVRHIGDEMGVAAAAMARRLDLTDAAFPFVLTGGVFRTLRSPLAEAAIARVRETAPRCLPTLPLLMPVAGAALLALDGAGQTVTVDHYRRLQEQGHGWHPEETFE